MIRNPRQVKVHSLKNQAVIADKCFVADSFFSRLKGLIGKKDFRLGEGMLFPACNDIHMWFMSIPIDVVFLRKEKNAAGELKWKVSSAHGNVKAWRPLPLLDWKASEALELPVGTIDRCGIAAGDELCID